MKAFYASRQAFRKSIETLHQETMNFYPLYLFAEESYYYCFMSNFVPLWNSREEWSVELSIEINYDLNSKELDISKEEALGLSDIIKKIKKQKNKTKQDLITIQRYHNFIQNSIAIAKINLEKFFSETSFWEWKDLFSNEVALPLGFSHYNSQTDGNGDKLIEILAIQISKLGSFLFMNTNVENILKAISIDLPRDAAIEKSAESFYNIPLFSYPFCFCLEKEKLTNIRSNMQAKLKPMMTMIDEFHVEIKNDEFNEVLEQKCRTFYANLVTEIETMQKHIDNEIYFQQYIHSNAEHHLFTLNIGVTTIDQLINYYEKSKTLQPHSATALKTQLNLSMDINKCYAFLYWTVELKQMN